MNKLFYTLIGIFLISCQAPKEKKSEQSNEPTIIGYEFNDKGEKLNLIAGDASVTNIYLEYIQAHNDKDLSKISEIDMDNIVVRDANGALINGSDSHTEQLDIWFNTSNPSWKVKFMVANNVQGNDGKNQAWLTTGVDLVQSIDGNNVTSHHIVDVNFVNGKVKELIVYDRASEQE
ncbi:MAG: hypothetical protein QNL28_05565 [Flavobacteriaceae bacterium]